MSKVKLSEVTDEMFREDMLKTLAFVNKGEDLIVINDHGGKFELKGYVILDDCLICPVFVDTPYFCLNALYVSKRDGKLHVSKASVGGTIIPMYHEDSLEKAILAYKKEREEGAFGRKVTEYKLF